jgi:hypothetical protein
MEGPGMRWVTTGLVGLVITMAWAGTAQAQTDVNCSDFPVPRGRAGVPAAR